MNKITFSALLFALSFTAINAQNNPSKNFGPVTSRCSTVEYEQIIKERDPQMLSSRETNEMVSQIIENQKNARISNNEVEGGTNVLVIPVVVHVIHNGDAYGLNENIRDEQVISQITVLNQDFRRMQGTPGFNSDAVGADVEIEFCLAKRDPNGQTTTGIDRVQLTAASYTSIGAVEAIKPITIWDPNQYMNIWVVNLGNSDLLGYAQFPNNSASQASTDGVVIGHRYFGSRTLYPQGTYTSPYDRGRTTTHEVGHFLGLIHIWGDNSSCTVNATDSFKDFCPDTPAAANDNGTCGVFDSCPSSPGFDMVENYMDYTNDSCMNIFTQNQRTRMRTYLTTFNRRQQLLTSLGCVVPLSTPAFELIHGLNVYPNPAQSTLNIDIKSSDLLPENYVIYNALGQRIVNKTVENNVDLSIDISGFTNGVYFIQITREGESKTLQFVKN
ncbi:MAG: M43 family zinc metalloprotease [Flavobacterium sp.]